MLKRADITFQGNTFLVSGELNFLNVVSVYDKSLPNLNHAANVVFDFSALKSSNSAGLALLLEWVKFAKRHHKTIKFINLSQALVSIAKAAGIANLIAPDTNRKTE